MYHHQTDQLWEQVAVEVESDFGWIVDSEKQFSLFWLFPAQCSVAVVRYSATISMPSPHLQSK